MAKKPRVSILVPFFGNFDPRRLEIALSSVQTQIGGRIEFLICTGKQIINLEEGFGPSEVQDALQRTREEAAGVSDLPRGLIYNQGIKRARGECLYLSDSDIVFPTNYFEELMQVARNLQTPLQRPMMRRLLLQDFEQFYKAFSDKGVQDSLKSLDFSQEFIAKPDANPRPIRVIKKWENGRMKTFIITEGDFLEYTSNPNNLGSEPKFFNQERHCGAIFARRKELEQVGGCCEGFISWGCWDADLQWKLKETYGISYMPGEVIHLDHPKGYFNKEKWQIDRRFQEARRARGAARCIQEDREVYN